MKCIWWQTRVSVASLIFACAATQNKAADTNRIEDLMAPPEVEVQQVANIRLSPKPPLKGGDEASISKLIKNLAEIQSPDFGLSPTMSGEAFAPIPAARQIEGFLFTDHKIKQSDDFAELVKLGPKALPFLLASLDDPTPTKLVIRHDFGFGGMWFANELRGNPGNDAEQKILGTLPKQEFLQHSGDDISSYTVKIGDVCFVAIGQIVGRSYQAVRYQPTACIVINSPTQDTNITAKVRAIWSNRDPDQHLLDSLLLDYGTHGVFNGRSLDGWAIGSSLQVGAVMRLLFYYPAETTNLVAKRLRDLGVRKLDTSIDVATGVRADEFIKAVNWSKEPAIRAELRGIFRTTAHPDILVATAVAMDVSNATESRKRFMKFISDLPGTEPGPFGVGYQLLVAFGGQFGDEARPAYERYMEHGSLQKRDSMCRVLEEVHGDWSVDLLGPLLEDKRPAEGWSYAVVPGQGEPRLPIRICDEAAEAISHNFHKLTFEMAGRHEDLDHQIQKMRDQIAHHDY